MLLVARLPLKCLILDRRLGTKVGSLVWEQEEIQQEEGSAEALLQGALTERLALPAETSRFEQGA